MKIYLLFGKTGSGKSHIGRFLEEQGIFHIDGDKHITDEMRECLKTDTQMTEDMIGRFVLHLAEVINRQKKEREQPFVVTQALYLDSYRQQLLEAVAGLEFVLIDSDESERMQRIAARHLSGESKVTPAYAIEMDKRFEEPRHAYKKLVNGGDDTKLQPAVEELMPELFERSHTLTL